MKCTKCQKEDTKVIDSRVMGSCVRRRRECLHCLHRFTTYEHPEMLNIWVIKRDGTREKFDRNKIKEGLAKAFNKRPFDKVKIDHITCEIENIISQKYSRTIQSKNIGTIILRQLKCIDQIAYLRFASVYKNFKNINTFYKELDKINNMNPNVCTKVTNLLHSKENNK